MTSSATGATQFSPAELASFQRDGFVVAQDLMPDSYLQRMRQITERDLAAHQGDIEYEAQLHYPGAPDSMDSEGGRTIRRLRQAVSRDPVFLQLVKEPFLLQRLQQSPLRRKAKHLQKLNAIFEIALLVFRRQSINSPRNLVRLRRSLILRRSSK